MGVKIINPDAIINIPVTFGYMSRANEVIKYLLSLKTDEEVKQAFEEIDSRNVKTEWVKHLETMIMLVKTYYDQSKLTEDGVIEVEEDYFKRFTQEDD
jgi:hypothetical protein